MEERGEEEEEEAEDQRREAALVATPLFQPGFKSSKVTQAQLDKLKELHKRRLQIRAGSKAKTKAKGNVNRDLKACDKDLGVTDNEVILETVTREDSNQSSAKGKACLDEVAPTYASLKRRKLHWGLDTKERWERKANM